MANPQQPDAATDGVRAETSPLGGGAFVEALRRAGVVSEPALRWAMQESSATGRAVHELLAERVPAAEEGVYRELAEFLGVAFDPLSRRQVDAELIRRLPSTMALADLVAPIAWEDDRLVVATGRTQMLARADKVATAAGSAVRMVLVPPSRLNRLLQASYGVGAETVSELVDRRGESDAAVRLVASEPVSIGEDLDSTQEASVIRFVNELLYEAVRVGASDMHIEPFEKQLRVRFRIDGMLQEVAVPPAVKRLEGAIISRVKVLGDLDIAEKRLSQDGQVRLSISGRTVDVRVSVLPSIYGESVVLRILDRQAQFRDLGELGMPPNMLAYYRDALSLAQQLVLVTGPTGSGKTTTLYASLSHVNRPGLKIVTVEDPVEYRLDGITQIQVKESIGLSFSTLLRSIVRHDPDVIMIGEIRDRATANIALNSAITGHLVLATLHTNDAPTAVTRLANMGEPWYMIASALKVVLAQRLVRLICPHCREPADDVPAELAREFPQLADQTLYRGAGCEACYHTGYSGRSGVFESFLVTPAISQRIAEGASPVEIRAAALEQGMVPLRRAAIDLVLRGLTTVDEVYRVTRDAVQYERAGEQGADG